MTTDYDLANALRLERDEVLNCLKNLIVVLKYLHKEGRLGDAINEAEKIMKQMSDKAKGQIINRKGIWDRP